MVNSVALHADGRRLVSGSSDNTVQVWNLDSGECLRTLQGHTKGVDSVALPADGRRAATGSSDTTVRCGTWTRVRAENAGGPHRSGRLSGATPDGRARLREL